MQTNTITFATTTKDNCVTRIGIAVTSQPRSRFGGGCVKWFDDRQLLKQKRA